MAISIPVFIGSFYLQSVSAFDTVQFFWIAIPLFGIPAGIIFSQYLKLNKVVGLTIIMLVVLLSLPGYFDFMLKYNPLNASAVADKKQLQFFRQVGDAVPNKKFITYIPNSKSLKSEDIFYQSGTPLISALTGKEVYLEGGGLPGKLEKIYKRRYERIIELDEALVKCDTKDIAKYLQQIGTNFILTENRYKCLEKNKSVDKTSSESLILYIYKKD